MSDTWRLALFLATVSCIVGMLAWHVARRLRTTFALPARFGRSFAAMVFLGILASAGSRFFALRAPALAGWLGAFGGAITLSVIISSVLLWPYEIAALLHRLVARTGITARIDTSSAHEPTTTRRGFITQTAVGGAVSLGVGSAVYGSALGRHDYTLETVPVRLSKLPRALDGFSIVQISDLHVGLFVGEYELERGLEIVARAKPDLVVLTGDLLDSDPRYAPALGRFVHALRSKARRGVFAIPGNHDYYAGVSDVLRVLNEAGAEVLLNRHVRIGDASAGFVLGGVDDIVGARYGAPGPRVRAAFDGAPPELARVLLSHNPAYYPEASAHADLTLSGHTHGGQITLFVNPAEVVLRHGFVRGHYHLGESQLYVNRGFGTAGPPARVGSPPEVTNLILTSRA